MAKANKGATAREAGIGQGADRRVFHASRSMHSLLIEGVDLMLVKHKG